MERFIPELYSVMFLSSIQGFILGIILLCRRGERKTANAIMAAVLFFFSFSISIHSIAHLVYIQYITDNHEFFMMIGLMNLGPLYYSYVRCLTDTGFRMKKFVARISPFYILMAADLSAYLLLTEKEIRNIVKEITLAVNFTASSVFILISVYAIIRYTRRVRNSYSNLDKINLRWLKFLGFCFLLFLLANIVLHVFLYDKAQGDVIWFISSVIIFIIAYFSLAQPEIFISFESAKDILKDNRKYKKSALTSELSAMYLKKLNTAMDNKKLYLDSVLTLPALAETTGVPVHYLSQIINESIGMNFYDYINSQRILEAGRLLTDPSGNNCNISTIAFDVGFNTLSSFNASFKKYMGMTPSQYKKSRGQCCPGLTWKRPE